MPEAERLDGRLKVSVTGVSIGPRIMLATCMYVCVCVCVWAAECERDGSVDWPEDDAGHLYVGMCVCVCVDG
jgi:hypothetical protein